MSRRRSGSWAVEGLNLGFGLAACIVVGFALGWLLDERLALETPWFTIGLTLVGFAAGMREVAAISRRLEKRSERERREREEGRGGP